MFNILYPRHFIQLNARKLRNQFNLPFRNLSAKFLSISYIKDQGIEKYHIHTAAQPPHRHNLLQRASCREDAIQSRA